tara:strand:+ start:3142 stop:3582 length:441 start_codon:yes stop_codon:yes gene_type:complete
MTTIKKSLLEKKVYECTEVEKLERKKLIKKQQDKQRFIANKLKKKEKENSQRERLERLNKSILVSNKTKSNECRKYGMSLIKKYHYNIGLQYLKMSIDYRQNYLGDNHPQVYQLLSLYNKYENMGIQCNKARHINAVNCSQKIKKN